MSLIKLFKASSKLFKKDVITFLIIRRHDLGIFDDKLRYIAVKPSASVSQLRQKIWHLLDLPDYCEEVIILKTEAGQEIALTALRNGNEPQNPCILEVFLPGKQICSTSFPNYMLTMGETKTVDNLISEENLLCNDSIFDEKVNREYIGKKTGSEISHTTITYGTNNVRNNTMPRDNQLSKKFLETTYKRSELSCKISTSSIFFKLHGRKSRDNFANILLKIQNDLTTLTNKLSDLENRIHV